MPSGKRTAEIKSLVAGKSAVACRDTIVLPFQRIKRLESVIGSALVSDNPGFQLLCCCDYGALRSAIVALLCAGLLP